MSWIGKGLLNAFWQPVKSQVRTRYYAEKLAKGKVKRYGYEEHMHSEGLLPHVVSGTRIPTPEYRPAPRWNQKRALFGQNDYIDILGNEGGLHPTKTLYNVPSWLRGINGNEFQILIRRKKFLARTEFPQFRPTKWKELQKRLNFLYKHLNQKTKTGFSHQ